MKISVLRGGAAVKVFELQDGGNLVGRWDPDSGSFPEIDLEDEDPEAKVSRKHAIIEKRGSIITIQDLGSRNGTYLNRETKIEAGVTHQLKVGDEIVVGKTFLKLEE